MATTNEKTLALRALRPHPRPVTAAEIRHKGTPAVGRSTPQRRRVLKAARRARRSSAGA